MTSNLDEIRAIENQLVRALRRARMDQRLGRRVGATVLRLQLALEEIRRILSEPE